MESQYRFDSLIEYHADRIFPECDWRLIRAQMIQESSADPRAVSPVGAIGLMQLMPATAKGLGYATQVELFDCENNLIAGISYLRIQYVHFPEIPDHDEKLKFSLASYNGGRGYINRALELAYEHEHGEKMPQGHLGALPGNWQKWICAKEQLSSPFCTVEGKTPDWKQMTDYVKKIWGRYMRHHE